MLRVKYIVNPVPVTKLIDRGFKAISNNLSYFSVKKLNASKQVCFIAGCGHSGTTLLAAKLSNHPTVFSVGRESNNFSPLRNLYFSREIIREWCFTADQFGKDYIIEKTPKHVHVINRILRVIPEAKIILMIRNPLDTCSSLYSRFNDLKIAVKRWNLDNGAVVKAMKKFSDSVLQVRYEDLTEHPAEELKRILTFLNLRWNEQLLSAGETVFNRQSQVSSNMQLRREQVKDVIQPNTGTWKIRLTEEQTNYVFSRTYVIAEKLGYDETFFRQYI